MRWRDAYGPGRMSFLRYWEEWVLDWLRELEAEQDRFASQRKGD